MKQELIVRWFFPGRAAVCSPRPDLPHPVPTGASDPWNDVGDEIGVDPVDDAGVDISHLKQGRNLGVPGTTIDKITSAMRHAPSVSVTITVIPDLTCRKTGSDVGAETPLP